nr:MAG TPA: hypothetical protein [Microviridae sp.]
MCPKENPSYHLGFSLFSSINAQLTLHHKWSSSHNFLKKIFENTKKSYTFVRCRSYNYY